MKVAIVIPSLNPRRGGAEQWTFQFIQLLAAEGHETHVVAREFGAACEDLAIVPHRVEPRSLGRWHAPCAFAAAADEALRGIFADIVHDMGFGFGGDVFQPHGGTRQGSLRQNDLLTPPVLRPLRRAAVRLLPRYRVQRRLEGRQYAPGESRWFIALSHMVHRDMCAFHRADEQRLRVIYNGVDVARFRPENRRRWRNSVREQFALGNDVVLLMIAHNFRLKGLATLIRATGSLVRQRNPVRLLVVGKGRDGFYRRLAQQAGCADRVHFAGTTEQSARFYAAADCYVQPTYYDPCSLVVLEALASGLPVVTSQFNGAGELITAGREGIVVNDPGDHLALTDCLGPLMDCHKRQAMGWAARKLALDHSLQHNYREILSLYEEVLRHKPHTHSSHPHTRNARAAS